MGICHIKVRIFWEDHEKWKMGQIFVPFSEYLNFTYFRFLKYDFTLAEVFLMYIMEKGGKICF